MKDSPLTTEYEIHVPYSHVLPLMRQERKPKGDTKQ